MKTLEITDDNGFLGIVNCATFNGSLPSKRDFDVIKKMLITEINNHRLLFWATGCEGFWKARFAAEPSDIEAFREFNGVIEVTDNKLYLINYTGLMMTATYEDYSLPSPLPHLQKLFIELANGKYLVKIRQITDPEFLHPDPSHEEPFHFEIIPMKITKHPSLYKNKVDEIYWFKQY